MTAKEFLDTKYPDIGPTVTVYDLIDYMEEYHAIASGQKIDLDNRFGSITDLDLIEVLKKDEKLR